MSRTWIIGTLVGVSACIFAAVRLSTGVSLDLHPFFKAPLYPWQHEMLKLPTPYIPMQTYAPDALLIMGCGVDHRRAEPRTYMKHRLQQAIEIVCKSRQLARNADATRKQDSSSNVPGSGKSTSSDGKSSTQPWPGLRAVIFSGGPSDDTPLGWPSEAKVMMIAFTAQLTQNVTYGSCWRDIQASGVELEYILEQASTSTITNARNAINLLLNRMALPLPSQTRLAGSVDRGTGHGRLLAGSQEVTRAQVLLTPAMLSPDDKNTFSYRGMERILVVTSQYHHYRSKHVFDLLIRHMDKCNQRQRDDPLDFAYHQQPHLQFEMAQVENEDANTYVRQFDFIREIVAIGLYKYQHWI